MLFAVVLFNKGCKFLFSSPLAFCFFSTSGIKLLLCVLREGNIGEVARSDGGV